MNAADAPVRRPRTRAVILTLLLPGLGFYDAGMPASRAHLINGAVGVVSLAAGWMPAFFLPWKPALLAGAVSGVAVWVLTAVAAAGYATRTPAGGPRPRAAQYIAFAAGSLAVFMVLGLLDESVNWHPLRTWKQASASMEPTILAGDRLLVNHAAYGRRPPAVGDVVVYREKDRPDRLLIKRVVAVGGESIRISDAKVVRNGVEAPDVPVTEDDSGTLDDVTYMRGQLELWRSELGGRRHWFVRNREGTIPLVSRDMPEFQVPEGTVYVLGDSRDNSRDSRHAGPVPVRDVLGRVEAVLISTQAGAVNPRRLLKDIE